MKHLLTPYPVLVKDNDGIFNGILFTNNPEFTPCKFIPDKGTDEVKFIINSNLPDSYYILSITSDEVSIEGKDKISLQYGLATLSQLIKQYNTSIPCMYIEDYPKNKHRGVQICLGQVFVNYKKEWMNKFIYNIALLKATHLYLYFEMDYPFLCLPYYRRKGQITQNDIKEIIKTAKIYNITVIPCLNVLGHCSDFLSYQIHDHLKEYDKDTQNPHYSVSGALCISSDEVKNLVSNMINEVCDLFPSDIIHVGGDEVDLIGKCPLCKPEFEKYGKNGIYLKYFIYINSLLKNRGRKMGVWADEVLIMEPESSFWNFRKDQCDTSKREQDLKLLDQLRDNTIFYDWYYNGESHITQEFFHKNNLSFIACASDFGCYMSSASLGQAYAEHALYSTAEKLGAVGMLTTNWINYNCFHAEMQYFPLASGLVLNWSGCGEKFCTNCTLDDFKKSFSLQKYNITDSSLTDYLSYVGDFESELVSLFPPTLRGFAFRKMVFSCTNPLTFSILYSPYLAEKNFDKYCKYVKKAENLYNNIDVAKQDKYFFINKSPVVLHKLLSKRYGTIEKALSEYDIAAKAQICNKELFKEKLTSAASIIRSHKDDHKEALDFANKCTEMFGLEKSPVLSLEQTLKNIDRLSDFILSMKDDHRLLPTFNCISKFLFGHPENSYWEAGFNDWLNEKEEFVSYTENNNPAPAAPRGFASEKKYVNY